MNIPPLPAVHARAVTLKILALVIPLLAFTTTDTLHAASTTLAISIRTLSRPYQVMYKVGAEAYAKQLGLPIDVLTTEANSQKGLTDLKAEVARTGGSVALYIDPNDAGGAGTRVKTCEAG